MGCVWVGLGNVVVAVLDTKGGVGGATMDVEEEDVGLTLPPSFLPFPFLVSLRFHLH